MKSKYGLFLLILATYFSSSVYASETYICNVKEEIEAKFDKGKWTKTSYSTGEGVYRVTIKDKYAEVAEQSDEKDRIKTNCKLVGGTVGYRCEKFTKIVPYAEQFKISFFHELNELTISSQVVMREMDDYSKESMKTRNYFNGIRFEVKEQYAQCVEYQ